MNLNHEWFYLDIHFYKGWFLKSISLPVGESDDPDELEVDLWDLSEPELSLVESAGTRAMSWPGLGTNITEMQLSSESRLVSLWMLESLLESLPDGLRCPPSWWPPSSGASRQHLRSVGDNSPPSLFVFSNCLGLFGDQAPFLWNRPLLVALSRLWSRLRPPKTFIGSMLTPRFCVKDFIAPMFSCFSSASLFHLLSIFDIPTLRDELWLQPSVSEVSVGFDSSRWRSFVILSRRISNFLVLVTARILSLKDFGFSSTSEKTFSTGRDRCRRSFSLMASLSFCRSAENISSLSDACFLMDFWLPLLSSRMVISVTWRGYWEE